MYNILFFFNKIFHHYKKHRESDLNVNTNFNKINQEKEFLRSNYFLATNSNFLTCLRFQNLSGDFFSNEFSNKIIHF